MRVRATTVGGIGREVLLVAFAAAVYGGVRAVTEGSIAEANANAAAVERLESALGIGWEHAAQSVVLGSATLTTLANWMYIFGHWPVIIAAAAVLYAKRPFHYRILRNALITSGLIGFAFFFLVPTSPPRLVAPNLVDTVLERSDAYRALQPPSLTNQYAAMPSLHFGWNLVVGIVLFAGFTGLAIRTFALVMPLAMAFAVVATANHFVLDVLVALVVVSIGLAVSVWVETRAHPSDTGDERSRNPNNPRFRARLQ